MQPLSDSFNDFIASHTCKLNDLIQDPLEVFLWDRLTFRSALIIKFNLKIEINTRVLSTLISNLKT